MAGANNSFCTVSTSITLLDSVGGGTLLAIQNLRSEWRETNTGGPREEGGGERRREKGEEGKGRKKKEGNGKEKRKRRRGGGIRVKRKIAV